MKAKLILGHSLRVELTMGKEAWRQEREAVVHIASRVRKQREMRVPSQLTSPVLFSLGPQPGVLFHTCSNSAFPPVVA